MKNSILILLFITLLSCTNNNIPKETNPSIPINSIYQKGDIVFQIDSTRSYEALLGKEYDLRNDIDFIYRTAKSEIILKNNAPKDGSEAIPQYMFIKYTKKNVGGHEYSLSLNNNDGGISDEKSTYDIDTNGTITFTDYNYGRKSQMIMYYSSKVSY